MEDKTELNQIKTNRTVAFSVHLPLDLNGKVEYIKKRTFLSKQRIVLISCAKNIESWCKQLMDEELAIRTAGGKVSAQPVIAPPPMAVERPAPLPSTIQQAPYPPVYPQPGPFGYTITAGAGGLPAAAVPNRTPPMPSPPAPFTQFREDAWTPGTKMPDKGNT